MKALVLALFLIGCGESLAPTTEPSPCYLSDATTITCPGTTLDGCIVAGHGTCSAGPLELSSDGITNGYVRYFPNGGTVSGTWSRQDVYVMLSDGNQLRLCDTVQPCQ